VQFADIRMLFVICSAAARDHFQPPRSG